MVTDSFLCNVCGTNNSYYGATLHRELLHCNGCGSCSRFRGIVAAINSHVLNVAMGSVLENAKSSKEIMGVGMSDADCYALRLERVFSYRNTYYHADPLLDITNGDSAARYQNMDFVISSDVLEHVHGPVINSLRNVWAMLKPGGKFIFSVPYVEGYETIEHYPQLDKFKIVQLRDTHVMVNMRPDGVVEMHQNLCFHGGPGSVLEMRIFGEGDLMGMLAHVGFDEIVALAPNQRTIGYVWEDQYEHALAPCRRSKSYVLVATKAEMIL